MTIDNIIEEMEQRVVDNLPISPASWVESSLRINALTSNIIIKCWSKTNLL